MRKRIRVVLALFLTTAATAALLWYALRGVPFNEVKEQILNADYKYALLAVLSLLMVFVLKTWRWQLLIRPVKQVRFSSLYSATMIGFMANCIISRVGELIRAAVLGVKREAPTSTVLATIAVERVFDMGSVTFFLILGILGLDLTGRAAELRTAGYSLACAMGMGVAVLILMRLWPERMERLALATTRLLPGPAGRKVEGFVRSFLPGLMVLRSISQVLAIIALSLVHWVFQIGMFQAASHCLAGGEPLFPLGFLQSCVVFAFTALGVAALPLPGFVGIFQGGVTAAMSMLGAQAGNPHVAAFSVLSWLVNIPPIILVGFICLWAEGMSLKELRTKDVAPERNGAR